MDADLVVDAGHLQGKVTIHLQLVGKIPLDQ
jgi:hypothetical protein